MAVYVIQKCAMSLDGYIDDASLKRLILSNPEDLARADAVRAQCDAILVGAGTIRKDDPSLLAKNNGKQLVKVTLTETGDLDPAGNFFTTGAGQKLVYCSDGVRNALHERLVGVAEVVSVGGASINLKYLLADLEQRSVKKLLIEAGMTIGTAFLKAGLVDELQVSVAPFFVGDSKAPRFVGDGPFYHDAAHRMELMNSEKLGDMTLLTYKLHRI